MRSFKQSKLLIFFVFLVYLFLYIPLIIIVVFSFNDSKISTNWVGFTFKWYQMLISNSELIDAAINSVLIALFTSIVSVVLGTLAGVALHKYKFRFFKLLVFTPLATPELLIGVALLLFYLMINFTLGFFSILFAHIAFCISFVAISVHSSMHNVDQNILHAAKDLGANSFYTFVYILLPSIFPGIIIGGLLSFTLSIDDFVITFFTAGTESNTLPIFIYSMIKNGITPEINAISTVIILFTIVSSSFIIKIFSKQSNTLQMNRDNQR